MLNAKYKTKIPYCPLCKRVMFSIENVENVVNPPQNPVTKRYFKYSFSLNKEENILYLKNAYRVLLTRARQGFIIFIPEGDEYDITMKPSFYDGIYEYFKEIGIVELD